MPSVKNPMYEHHTTNKKLHSRRIEGKHDRDLQPKKTPGHRQDQPVQLP